MQATRKQASLPRAPWIDLIRRMYARRSRIRPTATAAGNGAGMGDARMAGSHARSNGGKSNVAAPINS
jgi:hypothetical protein